MNVYASFTYPPTKLRLRIVEGVLVFTCASLLLVAGARGKNTSTVMHSTSSDIVVKNGNGGGPITKNVTRPPAPPPSGCGCAAVR